MARKYPLQQLAFGTGGSMYLKETMGKPYPSIRAKNIIPVSAPRVLKRLEGESVEEICERERPERAVVFMLGSPEESLELSSEVVIVQYYHAEF